MNRLESAVQPPQSGPTRILIIEDDPVVRFNTQSWLEDSGYRVDQADDGATGLAFALENPPDLVLCDLRMPGMDGFGVLRELGAARPELPIIVVSGTGVLGDAVESLRQGAWDFVVKPIQDMAVLEHAIEGALEKARLIRQNHAYQSQLEQVNRTLREQLERIHEDADAGRRIQLQLMPCQEKAFGPYSFSRCLLASTYLSGDFVDYFHIDPRHLGFFIADVSGHGVSSAFVTVLLKSFVQRALERLHQDGDQRVLEPLRMLETLNAHLLEQAIDKYLTIFYGVIERRTGQIRYANGGHFPSPMLVERDEARFLAGRAMPIGLFPSPELDAGTLDLAPGNALILCSDGVLETTPGESLDARLRRLIEAVKERVATATELVERLGIDPARAYPDDITVLTLVREQAT
ncbi:SpoIIE family protein phosphatase [Thiocystis violacea]|uniref:SpoIIE family protein phosphatase n=1 Tax=Thiocystis violacea TaxID=13725 RepID=UPI0019086CA8|nr:SpoIIE family protein phosphatase [Thiocystis violacea]MBK1721821.1 hypothetical protein [Thiocystis violacea]